MERVRLAQLMGTKFTGTLLVGGADLETLSTDGSKRDITTMSRQSVNVSLSNKLMAFQAGLDKNELSELLLSMSRGSVRQSSFGTTDRPGGDH